MTTEMEELVSVKEAAKALGISKCSLYRWRKRGWIAGIMLPNGTIRIPQAALDRILADKRLFGG